MLIENLASTSGFLAGLEPAVTGLSSFFEVSHIFTVKGEISLRGMRVDRNVSSAAGASAAGSVLQTAEGCSGEGTKTVEKSERLCLCPSNPPPPFAFHPSPSPEFQMGMKVFLPAFSELRINNCIVPQMASPWQGLTFIPLQRARQ